MYNGVTNLSNLAMPGQPDAQPTIVLQPLAAQMAFASFKKDGTCNTNVPCVQVGQMRAYMRNMFVDIERPNTAAADGMSDCEEDDDEQGDYGLGYGDNV